MLKIVYMGTPIFAVGAIEAIYNAGYDVAAIVTAPDKPAGRGRKLSYSDVKIFAEKKNIPILQPSNLKSHEFIYEIKKINPDLIVVIAFRMLPEILWRIPNKGTINLHASMLPNYRGAAPINWAIINGEKKTGLSAFFINEKIDTGDIIIQKEININENENFGSLHDRLMELSKIVVLNAIEIIEKGYFSPTPQKEINLDIKNAPKLNKENTRIDWSKSASEINNLIRGLSPTPCAWTTLVNNDNEFLFKVYDATICCDNSHSERIGMIKTDGKSFIEVFCGVGSIKINKLQLSGKKIMSSGDLLRGYANIFNLSFFK